MDAVAAVNALVFINNAVTVLIVADRSDGAGTLAGADQMHDCAVRAGLRAHAAFLALVGINMRTELADCDSAELAGVKTSLS